MIRGRNTLLPRAALMLVFLAPCGMTATSSQCRAGALLDKDEAHTMRTVRTDSGISVDLVYIEPGTFMMGRTVSSLEVLARAFGEVDALDEGPAHKVTLTRGYYLGKHKVTVEEYCMFLNAQPLEDRNQYIVINRFARVEKDGDSFVPKEGASRCAINVVTWKGADAFCRWLSQETKLTFRLPTEAEWEFAARGPGGWLYPREVNAPPGKVDNEEQNELQEEGQEHAKPRFCEAVDALPQNVAATGLVGMIDLVVGEWVSDFYGPYSKEPQVDPVGPEAPTVEDSRVLRRSPRGDSLTDRDAGDLEVERSSGVYGFRVLLEVDTEEKP